jgi:hypothetical protein
MAPGKGGRLAAPLFVSIDSMPNELQFYLCWQESKINM